MSKRSISEYDEKLAQAALVSGQAFQRLAARFIPKIPAIKEETTQNMSSELGDLAACAANLGFAIELYIKALLIYLGLGVPHEHDLRALYDRLPQPDRDIIEDDYETEWPKQAHQLSGHMGITIAKGPQEEPRWHDNIMPPSLPELLDKSRDLFQSWRYIFEFTSQEERPYQFHKFEYGFLWCAADAIKDEITVRLRGIVGTPPVKPIPDEP